MQNLKQIEWNLWVDSAAVSIFEAILVELTVFVNSTNKTTNIETAVLSTSQIWAKKLEDGNFRIQKYGKWSVYEAAFYHHCHTTTRFKDYPKNALMNMNCRICHPSNHPNRLPQ